MRLSRSRLRSAPVAALAFLLAAAAPPAGAGSSRYSCGGRVSNVFVGPGRNTVRITVEETTR